MVPSVSADGVATSVGETVRAVATVIQIVDRSIVFSVEAHDSDQKIGEGTHARAPASLSGLARRLRRRQK